MIFFYKNQNFPSKVIIIAWYTYKQTMQAKMQVLFHNKHVWALLYSFFPLKKVMCLLLPSRLLGLLTKAIIQESWLLQEYWVPDKKFQLQSSYRFIKKFINRPGKSGNVKSTWFNWAFPKSTTQNYIIITKLQMFFTDTIHVTSGISNVGVDL